MSCTHTCTCTVATTVIPRTLQLHRVFLPAILGKVTTITRCLSATYTYHQHAHKSIERPVHDLLQPPGVRSRPPAQAHDGMEVAVVKLDQLLNWSRKVNNFVQESLNRESSALRMHSKAVWPVRLWQAVPETHTHRESYPCTLSGHSHGWLTTLWTCTCISVVVYICVHGDKLKSTVCLCYYRAPYGQWLMV